MKEVKILSLGGHVLALENDARDAIEKYLDHNRTKLKANEAVDEIIEDLELAITAHLSEQGYNEKRAASKRVVDEVLKQIGSVEDEKEVASEKNDWRNFFNQPFVLSKNRVVFGVAGTIAERLGIDAFWIRFAFILLTFMTDGGFIWLYVVVGIALAILEEVSGDKSPPKLKQVVQTATNRTVQTATGWQKHFSKLDLLLRKIFRIIFASTAIAILIASLTGLAVILTILLGQPNVDVPLIGTARDAMATIFVVSGFGLLIWMAGGILVASLSSKRKNITNRGWQVVAAIVPTVVLASAFLTSGYYQRDRFIDWAERHPGNQFIEAEKWNNGEIERVCFSPFGHCQEVNSIKRIDTYSPDGQLIESKTQTQ